MYALFWQEEISAGRDIKYPGEDLWAVNSFHRDDYWFLKAGKQNTQIAVGNHSCNYSSYKYTYITPQYIQA